MKLLRLLLIIVVIAAIAAFNFFTFQVREDQQSLVLEFGNPKRVESNAGLHFKSITENIVYFDKKNLEFDMSQPIEVITKSEKRLKVDAFIRYKIQNPQLYYERMGQGSRDERMMRINANRRLNDILGNAMRKTMGESDIEEIINTKRAILMQQVQAEIAVEANKFGVHVVDVRVRQADFPDKNAEEVFQRMISDYDQQAKKITAEGEEEKRKIEARADKDVTVILAQAEEEAQKIRGRADAERNAIFASAYNKDVEFFNFYRSMTSYEETFKDGKMMVISPDSDYFDYFENRKAQ